MQVSDQKYKEKNSCSAFSIGEGSTYKFELYVATHYQWPPIILFYFILFLCFHMVFNNSSLFMSMSNLIYINIHFMDMKRRKLIGFFIFMLVEREKDWSTYEMEVVIKKRWWETSY
jgi:hypothetical protein